MVKNIKKYFFSTHNHHTIPLIAQLPLYFFIICTSILTAWYLYMNHSLVPGVEHNLLKISQTTETAINAFIKTTEKNASLLAQAPQTKKMFNDFTSQKSIKKELREYNAFIASQQDSMLFKNILLIDLNKTILYSSSSGDLVNKQLTRDIYKNSFLSLSYERAVMSLTPDFSEYGRDSLFEKPTLFLTVPVIDNQKIIGILAYECDVQKIISLTHHYSSLGDSGEIVLAQQKNSFLVFINPSRNDKDLAFKHRKISTDNFSAIQKGILGQQGTGKAIDYRNVPVIASWTFITKINWGMVVKIDQSEILHSLHFIIKLLLLFIVLIIAWIFIIGKTYHTEFMHIIKPLGVTPYIKKIPAYVKNYYFFLLLFSCAFLLKNIFSFYYHDQSIVNVATQNIIKDITNGAEDIDKILTKISFTSKSIADDLLLNRLSKDDITKRIKRDLAENDTILSITIAFAPYKYDPSKKLYAPTISKVNDTYQETMLEDQYDYTKISPQNTINWYQKAVQSGHIWLNAKRTSTNKVIPAIYALAFYNNKKELQGVIRITYNFTDIERITAYSSLARKGYSILLSENNTFIAHPVNSFVETETTFLDYAQENASQSLLDIAQKLSSHNPLLATYRIPSNRQLMWIYAKPLTTNNWTLAAIFSKDDISMPATTVRHNSFAILMYAILTLFLTCAYAFSLKRISFLQCITMINIFLVLGLILSWYIIRATPSFQQDDSVIITDQASLDKFIDDLEEEAMRKQEDRPIVIPCGLLLYSIDMPRSEEITVSGYIWTKYHTEINDNITRQIKLPHATKLIVDQPTKSILNNWETVTWNIRGTIYEKQNYSQFPFDKQRMQITIEHHDIEKNIILVPDLEDYKKISPEETPGLDKNFTLSEFNIETAFFNYKKIDPVTNFGFSQYGKTTDHFLLMYNLIIARGLLNPFILFFLPLLVILFSLFSVLIVAKQTSKPLTIISPYTGLFFALVLLHRSLREQYSTGATLYIEYAFFFAYITIILLVIHTVLVYLYPQWNYYQQKIFPLAKLLFWPLQLASWLITTLIIFY